MTPSSPTPTARTAAAVGIPQSPSVTQSPTRITMTRGLTSSSSSLDDNENDNNNNDDLRNKLSLIDLATDQESSKSGSSETSSSASRSRGVTAMAARPSPPPPAATTATTTRHQQHSHQPHHPNDSTAASASASAAAHQAGILASGLAWVDRQRERRRRQYLQMQAEQQLQKIKEAERAARKNKTAATVAVAAQSGSLSLDQQQTSASSSSPAAVGAPSDDDGVERTGSASGRGDRSRKVGGLHADISKSGEGATGRIDLSDLDVSDSGTGTGRDYYDDDTNEELDYSDTYENSNASTSGGSDDNDNDGVYNDRTYDDDDNIDDDEFPIPPVRVEKVPGDDDPNNPFILTADQMHKIASHVLPKTVAFCRWRRLYGLGRDGDSFDGCLRIIGNVQRTLMVVRTSQGSIFGGYSESTWHSQAQHGDARFFGSAAACLFSFALGDNIKVYRWTGKNRYIQLCDLSHKMIAFGGGGDDGAFGLCVQDDFQRGSTGPCDTFDNDPLCPEDNFDVVDVEFWQFMTGVF